MSKPEFCVERGPVTEAEPFAIGMAKLLEREGRTIAAAELRRLHTQRDALLEALRPFAETDLTNPTVRDTFGFNVLFARAAIKAAEETK